MPNFNDGRNQNYQTNEENSFCEDKTGAVAKRTCAEITNPEDIVINTAPGLSGGGTITKITVSNTWVKLPATPETDRVVLSIQNQGPKDLYIQHGTIQPVVATDCGIIIRVGEERTYTITDTIEVWGATKTAAATEIVTEEIK